VILEHKGLYWSKIKGTEEAKTIEPDENYIIPFGKARMVLNAEPDEKPTLTIITYGMGVYWAKSAAKDFPGQIEIIDLRTIVPLDEKAILNSVRKHGRCLVVTEEPVNNSFALSIAGLISDKCFESLDAPVQVIGSENLPAIPLNSVLEERMIPNAEKVKLIIGSLLKY
jgi:2-oxoisovalerate dehydrogenase E1 component